MFDTIGGKTILISVADYKVAKKEMKDNIKADVYFLSTNML